MKKVIIITLLAGLVLAGLLVYAQERKPHDPAQRIAHHVQFLTEKLSLTPAQQQQATTLFTNAANAEKSTRDQMRTAHQNLEAAVEKNDGAAIDQASSALGSLIAQSTAARAKAHAAFWQSLTPDQQTKLKAMESHGPGKHMRGRHGHGFDGPGGPPPGGPQD